MTQQEKESLFAHYKTLHDLYERVIDDKLKIRKQELESQKQMEESELNQTLEAERTQYIIDLLDDSSESDENVKRFTIRSKKSVNYSEDNESKESNESDDKIPVEPIYIQQDRLRIEKNTPLNRNTRIASNARQFGKKRRVLEPIESGPLKVPKTEIASIKQEPKSLRTTAQGLSNIEITKNGFKKRPVTPDQIRVAQKQILDLTGMADDQGMITILNQTSNVSEISEIKIPDHITITNKSGSQFGEIKNQPQSTKNYVFVSSPDTTLSPVPTVEQKPRQAFLKVLGKPVQISNMSGLIVNHPKNVPVMNPVRMVTKSNPNPNNSSFPSPPMVVNRAQETSRGIQNAAQSTKQNISSEVTIKKVSNKKPEAEESHDLNDEPPMWFSDFMMKFQSMIHRQNSIEEKMDSIFSKLNKIEKLIQK
jgi:hypothetical protein